MKGYRFVRFCSFLLRSENQIKQKIRFFTIKFRFLCFWVQRKKVPFSIKRSKRVAWRNRGGHVNKKARLFSIETFEPYEIAANTRIYRLI